MQAVVQAWPKFMQKSSIAVVAAPASGDPVAPAFRGVALGSAAVSRRGPLPASAAVAAAGRADTPWAAGWAARSAAGGGDAGPCAWGR